MKNKFMKRLDLRRHPYRGIIKEIADEQKRDSASIHRSLFSSETPDPALAAIFDRKLQERQASIKSFKKTLRKTV
jgi:hypothetical protein